MFFSPGPSVQRHIQPSASIPRHQQANQAQPSGSSSNMQPRQAQQNVGVSNPAPQAANLVNLNVSQSSEAVPIDNGSDEDEIEYLDHEPQLLRPPHTPADSCLISSSTGKYTG